MRRFLEALLRHRFAALATILIAVATGATSLRRVPLDWLPRLDIPIVNIFTHLPGSSAESIELFVTRPIEDALRAVPDLQRVSSVSMSGISHVTAELAWGTPVEAAYQSVTAALSAARGRLPSGVEPWIEGIGTTLQEVAGYVVTGEVDLVQLRTLVEVDIASRLLTLQGVARVQVLGGDQRSFDIRIKPERLAALGLTVSELIAEVRASAGVSVAGYYERSGSEYTVVGDSRIHDLDDLRSLPVSVESGRTLRLGDIAQVSEGRVKRHHEILDSDQPAVAFLVQKHPGASSLAVARAVESRLEDIAGVLPTPVRIRRFYDQTEAIEEAKDSLLLDLALGSVLAVLVLLAFTASLRSTLIVSSTIPLTLLVTVALLEAFDLSFNIVTLSALTLTVGMIVDDSIIVAENITRRLQGGLSARRAAIEGSLEITGPDIAGTLTTVAAFLPLAFVHGIAGIFLWPFGVTVSSALIVSLVLSLTLMPLLCAGRPRSASERVQPQKGDEVRLHRRILEFHERAGTRLARLAVRNGRVAVLLSVVLVLAACLGAVSLPVDFLPPVDEGSILIEYILPPGTSLSESDRFGSRLERSVLADPAVELTYRRTGSPSSGHQIEGSHRGEILAKLRPRAQRTDDAETILRRLRHETDSLTGAVFLHRQPTREKIDESFSGLPAVFGVTLFGDDLDRLTEAAALVEEVLSTCESVEEVINNSRVRRPEMVVRVNHTDLASYGLRGADVLVALRAALTGEEAVAILDTRETISVRVHLDAGPGPLHDRLPDLPLRARPETLDVLRERDRPTDSTLVPLGRVASFQLHHVPDEIHRLNGRRQVTVLAEIEGNLPAAVASISERLEETKLPACISWEFSGQYPLILRTATELAMMFLLASLLIYTVLVIQFRSLLLPLAVIVVTPVTLAGAIIALLLCHQGLDISVGMGLLTLLGVSVNNAIILVDFRERSQLAGLDNLASVERAVAIRLRPIVMTSLTTTAALLPAALATGGGSHVFRPFAVSVIGGLLSGLLATLVVLPALLSLRIFSSPRSAKTS